MPKVFGKYKILGYILAVVLIVIPLRKPSTTQAYSNDQIIDLTHPRYVFLFIGDGMGMAQREVVNQYLTLWSGDPQSDVGQERLLMDQLPITGTTSTDNVHFELTDSAAAGTAIATGQKTDNKVISMSADLTKSYTTIAEIAHEKGWKVGIISSVSLNQATPAAFYAHTASRENLNKIWRQLLTSQFDYFAGGGIETTSGIKDFVRMAGKYGYTTTQTRQDFLRISSTTGKVIAMNPVQDLHKEMPYVMDRNGDSLSLADFTDKGIEVLSNETGFFLMVEGGRIDTASHDNDGNRMVGEVLAFDEAIARAFEFYLQHPADTLIVVTADHETGGLQMITPQSGVAASLIPPVAAKTKGGNPIRIRNEASHGYSFDDAGGFTITSDLANTVFLPDYFGSISSLQVSELNFTWTTKSHTDAEILTTAVGAGAEAFSGSYENTDIFWKLLDLTGLGS